MKKTLSLLITALSLIHLVGCKTTPIPTQEGETIRVWNKRDVIIKDIKISGIRSKNGETPIGIDIKNSSNVTIDNVTITDIKDSDNAHGILVHCSEKCENITIKNSRLYNLELGTSEAISLTGNIDGFLIQNNTIYDVNNIAIDAIGGEGVAEKDDYARNGIIEGNHVYDTHSPYAWAAAGYCDMCSNVIFRNNIFERNDLGIEVASEHKGKAQNVTVINNTIKDSLHVGILLGSYKSKFGGIDGCTVKGNKMSGNKVDIEKQYNVKNCVIEK